MNSLDITALAVALEAAHEAMRIADRGELLGKVSQGEWWEARDALDAARDALLTGVRIYNEEQGVRE